VVAAVEGVGVEVVVGDMAMEDVNELLNEGGSVIFWYNKISR